MSLFPRLLCHPPSDGSIVYGYFLKWRKDGTWLVVHDTLYQWVRVAARREPSPSEIAVDTQSVETATMISQEVGTTQVKKYTGVNDI